MDFELVLASADITFRSLFEIPDYLNSIYGLMFKKLVQKFKIITSLMRILSTLEGRNVPSRPYLFCYN